MSKMASLIVEAREELCINDLGKVYDSLIGVSPKWYEIGLQVGVPVEELEKIHYQYGTKFPNKGLREMLLCWLKQVGIKRELGHETPSWSVLLRALRRDSIGENVLAESLKDLRLQNEDTDTPQKSMSEPIHSSISIPPVELRSLSANDNSIPLHQPQSLQQDANSIASSLDSSSVSSQIGDCTSVYRHLDVGKLTKDKKDMLEARLTIEYEQISDQYAELTDHIISSLSDRNVTPEDLAVVLMNLNAYSVLKGDGTNQPLLRDCLGKIREASSLNEAFYILHPYGSFFDCHIIKRIVNSNLCTNDDREKLNQYTTKLDNYCKRNIFECPCLANSDVNPDLPNCELTLKVGNIVSTSFTGSALTKFQAKLAMSLGIELHTLVVRSVEAGCVKLTFQIPNFVAKAIFPLSSKAISSLKLLGIVKLTCGGIEYDFGSFTSGASKPTEGFEHQSAQPEGNRRLITKEEFDSTLTPAHQSVVYPRSTKGCVIYRLLGECRFGSECRYGHSIEPIPNPSIEHVAIPKETSVIVRKNLIRRVDYSPSGKSFITLESKNNPSEEIKIVAEDDATLKFAKEVVFTESLIATRPLQERECVRHKLLKCTRDSCSYVHGDIVESPSIGYVSHPVGWIPNLRKLIGMVGHCPSGSGGSFMVVESDKDKHREVKVYAENEETLKYATKAVYVKFGELHSDHRSVAATTIALCYVHPEGVETPGLQLRLEKLLERGKPHYLLYKAGVFSGTRAHVETYQDLIRDLPHPVYYLLDHPEKTRELKELTLYPAQVRVMKDFQGQIHKKLYDALRWMYDQRLRPKLEGRFGKLHWAKIPGFLQREPFNVHRFVSFILKNDKYMRFFRTQLEKSSMFLVLQELTDLGSEVETYDMKIAVKNKGKLDIRLQFIDEHLKILAVKKDEEKLLLCDILSLHRDHDMRISLNTYQTSEFDDPTVEKFVSTVHKPEPNTLAFIAQDYNKDWTARVVRHKKRHAYSYGPNKNYVVTISSINTYDIKTEDLDQPSKQNIITIKPDDWKEHHELELHNLKWEVAFGHQFGSTPQQSLSLLMEPDKIPTELTTSTPCQWNPDSIMEEFARDGFLQMLDNINRKLVVC